MKVTQGPQPAPNPTHAAFARTGAITGHRKVRVRNPSEAHLPLDRGNLLALLQGRQKLAGRAPQRGGQDRPVQRRPGWVEEHQVLRGVVLETSSGGPQASDEGEELLGRQAGEEPPGQRPPAVRATEGATQRGMDLPAHVAAGVVDQAGVQRLWRGRRARGLVGC